MTSKNLTNVPTSVRQRLLNLSKVRGEVFGLTLLNYAIERLLARLERSKFADQFVLKGAQLFKFWMDSPHRATRDLDLLRLGQSDIEILESIFRELCASEYDPPDGIVFDPSSIKGSAIREDGLYQGIRLTIQFSLSGARDTVQIDIGVGDAMEPQAQWIEMPSALDFSPVRILAYAKETAIAEKLEAMVILGIRNSRMKDFYDIRELLRTFEFDGAQLCRTIDATFKRRKTAIPAHAPLALTPEFASEPTKQQQWIAFLRKGNLVESGDSLASLVNELYQFLIPPLDAVSQGVELTGVWKPGVGWQEL